MNYILPEMSEYGYYSAPQSEYAPGLLVFPDEFMPVFYPEDKQAAGFVTIRHDGETVTDCRWNEEAYQAWLAALPEPVDPPEPPPTELEQLRADVDFLAALQGVSL